MKRLTFILCTLLMLVGAQTVNAKNYDLTICRYDTTFYETNNDVFMILYTEDYEATLRLDIKLEEGQRFFTDGKTYTWDDMIHKFCYAYVKDEYREYKFADANFTYSLDSLGLEHFIGSAIDSVGNTYNFHYDVLPYIPSGDTIEVSFSKSLSMEHSEEWYFHGTEGDYYVLLTLINDGNSPVGHYTEENIVMDFSYIDKNLGGGNYELIYFHHADVTVTEAADDTLRIDAMIAALDTNVYHFQMFYSAPKPLIKKTITATDLYINTDYLYGMIGAFQVEASDDTHSLKLALSPMTADMNIYDTYPIAKSTPNIGYVVENTDPDTEFEVFEGTVTISKTENGAVLTGTLLCSNDVEYTLDLSYAVPEKTRDEELKADGMLLQANMGAWRISGYSADSTRFVALVLNGFGIAGKYSIVEMSPLYSYVVTDITWTPDGEVDDYNYFSVIDADLTVDFDETDSIATVTGTVLAQNMEDIPEFTIQLSNKPAKEEAVEQIRPVATATKRFENGILVIEKNNVKYNILGNIIR